MLTVTIVSNIVIESWSVDGKQYKKTDWFDYYYFTPSLIRHAPESSDKATYRVVGGDEHENFVASVTWTDVKDVSKAVGELNAYLVKEGIDVEKEYNLGTQYFVLHYDDIVVLKIEECPGTCP